ncbi:MAG: T9SS type B sorting domain-containing protein, partial [Saprospiraceae bacterium]|nr:T9SS type B sorting domain-containing protein [Saprospiraceae bacterium]
PYTYEWSLPDQDNRIENLEPGRYDLTVTDTLGCKEMTTFVIDNPPKLEYEFVLVDSINCSSTEGAQVFLDVQGGEAPYEIEWSTSQVGPYINTFIEGPIQFTITDNRNCVIEGEGNVIREEGFEIIFSEVMDLNCFTIPNGQATINISGGSSPFQFQWSNGETGETAENLLAGLNNVTVTDSEGCRVVGEVVLDAPPALVILHDETPTTCFGNNDGRLEIQILGGFPGMQGYDIAWDNGSQNPVQENLEAGTYCLTVTDEYNCSVNMCFQVSDAEQIDIQTDLVQPFCLGDASGEISVATTGGTGSYTYNWSGPNSFSASSSTITNLVSGTYLVTVTDENVDDCNRIFNIELEDRSEVEAALTIMNQLECHGVDDAVIIAESLGGNGPFEYEWSDNIIVSQNEMASQLGAGTFSVTITDSDNCTAVQSIQLEYPPAIGFSFFTTDNICYGDSSGTVEAYISGGNGNPENFELLWDSGTSGNQLTNLPAGTYTLSVTDEKGCTSFEEIEILQPTNDIEISLDEYNTSCNANNDGRIDVFVSNAMAPIIYSLNDTTWQANNSFVQLNPGLYTIYIRDANGCTQSENSFIQQTAKLIVDAGENLLVEFGGTVTLNATVMNHSGDVFWEWTSSNIENFSCPIGCPNPEVIDVTKSFSAKVTATDSKNCSGEDYVSVNVFEEDQLFVPKAFSPNADGVNDALHVFGNPKIHVLNFKVYSRWGELLYHESDFFANDTSKGWNGFLDGEVVNQGTYVWTAEYQLLSGKIDFSRGQTTLLK